MEWRSYLAILLRRWWIIVLILLVDVLASGYLYAKANKSAGQQSCFTLYVSDVSSPSLISAPPTTLQAEGQLLAGETAANFFADDILDVAQSKKVADYVSRQVAPQNLPNSSASSIEGSVSGSRRDRTVDLCVANPTGSTAQAASQSLASTMTSARSRFIGIAMAKRTFVNVVSQPTVSAVPKSHQLANLALRLFLGLMVALGLALLWDSLDPTVRDERDVEEALGVPVLARA